MDAVTARTVESSEFLLPPSVHNGTGQIRKAGFELEYAGVDIEQSGGLVQAVFGGSETVISTFVRQVETDLGKFQIEIDTNTLKDKTYETILRAVGVDPAKTDLQWLEKALLGTVSTIVPIEIATPPVPITNLPPLDVLRQRLRDAKAKGTRASLFYAFGMHINPEIPSDDPAVLRDILRAFILLYPWIKERAQVDFARRVTPFVNAFPDEYARLLLSEEYSDDATKLIDDYMLYNPTRNRALDMLPVLAYLDADRVQQRVEDDQKLVKPRPAFHYRLPNCMIDERHWSLAREWNLWVMVERLAEDKNQLAELSRDFLAADEASFKPFTDKWPAMLAERLETP